MQRFDLFSRLHVSTLQFMLHRIVHTSFFLSMAITLIGATLKIMHLSGAETLLAIGLITSLVFIVSAIIEVRSSNRLDHREKTMWTIAFLFLNGVAGILYMVSARRRVI